MVLGSAVAVAGTAAAADPVAGGPPGTFSVTGYGGKVLSIPVTDRDVGTPETFASGLPDLTSVTVSGGTVFALGHNGSVRSIPAAGGDPTVLARIEGTPWGVTASGQTLYVAVLITGGDSTELGRVKMRDLVTVGDDVYATVLNGGIPAVPKTGGDAVEGIEGLYDPRGHCLCARGGAQPGSVGFVGFAGGHARFAAGFGRGFGGRVCRRRGVVVRRG